MSVLILVQMTLQIIKMYNNRAYGRALETLDIMILDENAGMRQIFSATLMSQGLRHVRTVSDANDALDEMLKTPPDILVADWHLSQSDTETLIRTLRTPAMHPLCVLPVIVLASNVSRGVIDEVLGAGANAILKKPVSAAALVARLNWITTDDREYELEAGRYSLPRLTQERPRELLPREQIML